MQRWLHPPVKMCIRGFYHFNIYATMTWNLVVETDATTLSRQTFFKQRPSHGVSSSVVGYDTLAKDFKFKITTYVITN